MTLPTYEEYLEQIKQQEQAQAEQEPAVFLSSGEPVPILTASVPDPQDAGSAIFQEQLLDIQVARLEIASQKEKMDIKGDRVTVDEQLKFAKAAQELRKSMRNFVLTVYGVPEGERDVIARQLSVNDYNRAFEAVAEEFAEKKGSSPPNKGA